MSATEEEQPGEKYADEEEYVEEGEGGEEEEDPEILEMKKRVLGLSPSIPIPLIYTYPPFAFSASIYISLPQLFIYPTDWAEMENEHEQLNMMQKQVEKEITSASDNLDECSM